MRLLLVETDGALSGTFKSALEAAGFEVELATGMPSKTPAHFPVVMISGRVEGEERAQLLRRLGGETGAPALVLLAAESGVAAERPAASVHEQLLEAFQIEAVVARLQALLSRKRAPRGLPRRFGNVSIDGEGQVVIAGKLAHFQPSEVLVLSMLIRRRGKIVPKRSIEAALYGPEGDTMANAVEVQIHRLRKSLAASAANLRIRTMRNAGYFVARDDAEC
jgi:DNA-binding response OmpR family regulator